MKPRIRLTEEQLRRLADMRARSYSWAAIGRELAIHRQIAKREYIEWEKRQVLIDLKFVRQQVAAEDFREHLELISNLGEEIGRYLEGCSLSRNWMDAEDAVRPVVDSSAPLRSENGHSVHLQQSERFRRQRRWLYDGLKSHAVGTNLAIDLAELERHRQRCSAAVARLEKLAEPQRMDHFQSYISKLSWDDCQVGKLDKYVLDLQWLVISELVEGGCVKEGMLGSEWNETVNATSNFDDHLVVMPETWAIQIQGAVVIPELASEKEALAVRAACLNMVKGMLFSDEAQHAALALNKVRRRAQALADQLDPLRLRPILLRTRCELCPV